MAGMHDAEGLAGDMGGGSLELIDITMTVKLVGGKTLPLGSLRLMDVTQGDMQKARGFIDENLDQVDWLDKGKGPTVLCRWGHMARHGTALYEAI